MINSIKSIENTLSANLNLTIMFQLHHSINTLKIPKIAVAETQLKLI